MKLSFVCAAQLMSSFLPSRLSVTSNNIGKDGLMSLNEAMKVNSCLTHIYIWGNKLEEPVCMVRFHKSINDQVQCSIMYERSFKCLDVLSACIIRLSLG